MQLACFRTAAPNGGNILTVMRWVALHGSESVAMGAHSTGCELVAAEYTFRLSSTLVVGCGSQIGAQSFVNLAEVWAGMQ